MCCILKQENLKGPNRGSARLAESDKTVQIGSEIS
jgi:hypothetical protein